MPHPPLGFSGASATHVNMCAGCEMCRMPDARCVPVASQTFQLLGRILFSQFSW